jgi:hypothetical protein
MRLLQRCDQLFDIDEVLNFLFRQDQHGSFDTTKRRSNVLRNQFNKIAERSRFIFLAFVGSSPVKKEGTKANIEPPPKFFP